MMPMRAVFWLVIMLAAAITLSGCGGSALAPAPGAALPTPAATPTLTPVGGASPKARLRGLIDMQDISWHNTQGGQPAFTMANVDQFPGLFGGIVINATWSQMQPTQAGAIDFGVVDADVAAVQAYNDTAANANAPLGVKLRIYAGANAPDWAKAIGGPITIYRNPAGCNSQTDTCPLTYGAFWTTPYITAWRAFQQQVAAHYDGNPLIQAVAVTSCASQTDEPFVPAVGPLSKSNMQTAGYSDASEQACLSGAIQDYAAWKETPIDFTFNTYVKFSGGGTDAAFTQTVMTACRQSLGSRCVLDNHALVQITASTPDAGIYPMIAAEGAPINFQTQAPRSMGCLWTETIAQGILLGASAIEVWPAQQYEGFDSLTASDVAQLRSLFYSAIATPTPLPGPTPVPPCSGFH